MAEAFIAPSNSSSSTTGGNIALIDLAARQFMQVDVLVVHCSWGRFGYPEGLLSAASLSPPWDPSDGCPWRRPYSDLGGGADE